MNPIAACAAGLVLAALITPAAWAQRGPLAPCTLEGVSGEVSCGTVEVPEDRTAPDGGRIPLSVIVLSATGASRQADPVLMLQGGPGDAPSFNARFYSRVFGDVRTSRDLVLVDLRGTGRSKVLSCPELAQPGADGILDSDLFSVPAITACRDRLARSTDLRQYTTEIAVDDLDEVRRALGYTQVNLYGTSYGSRVAQVYMRRHGEALRTVSMKGIVPQSMAMPATHARFGEDAWRSLVSRCAGDPSCHSAYPALATEFEQILSRLETQPPVMEVPASRARPLTRIRVTRGLFAEAFRNLLYLPEAAAGVPSTVHRLATGDRAALAETALNGRLIASGDRLAAGFFLSVTCAEDVPFLPADAKAHAAGTFGGDYRLQQQLAACAAWPRGTVSEDHGRLVRSDVPALVLSGEFDPVTPPAGGDEVVAGLARGRHVVIRNNGHPIGSAEHCIGQMMARFIETASAASIDTSCAQAVPPVPFELPKD